MPRAREDRPDRELFEALATGRPEALEDLYDRHTAARFRHALALTRRREDAEDLVQVVCVKLSTTGAALLGVRKPAGYLHRMLHTAWLDAGRRLTAGERAVEAVSTEPAWPAPAVEESMISQC